MRSAPDLHPDDRGIRIALRDILVQRRTGASLGQRGLAHRIGVTQNAVYLMETAESWRLLTVQRWARGLHLRLVLRVDGLPGQGVPDLLDAFRPTDPERAEAWDRAVLVDALTAARTSSGVRQVDLAAVLGVTERAVGAIETAPTELLFATPQRYCRALGGSLTVDLEPVFTRIGVAA